MFGNVHIQIEKDKGIHHQRHLGMEMIKGDICY